MASTARITVDGHDIALSNLDKVLYPETGTTKGDVLEYYRHVAALLVPQAAWRPATRKRWVDGVGTPQDPGKVFFRKDLEDSAPAWVPRAGIEHHSGTSQYPLINSPAVLLWLAQLAALEIHTPQWRFDEEGRELHPDRMVLDLDPGPGAGLTECAQVARWCREILAGMHLDAYPVTSGSKGIHLYAPLDATVPAAQVEDVAHRLARALEQEHPDLVVSDMKKSLRGGKVLIDWSQNNGHKTTVCPYSLRGRFRPTVAAPRTWEELDDPELRHLEWHEVLARADDGIDPLAPLRIAADRAGVSAGDTRADAPQPRDGADLKLERYRSMRSADATPEPVPQAGDVGGQPSPDAPTFVIQEHHATRLHWDFRLEHDGVLVSWAVPKGPPLEATENHLAVQTEDHPLSYGSFEGTIPKGQYGGGVVTIWDAGTIDIEKWRDGKEVIVTCYGRPDGGLGGVPRRFAFIHTGRMGKGRSKDEQNWLLHFTEEQPGTPGGAESADGDDVGHDAESAGDSEPRDAAAAGDPEPTRPEIAAVTGSEAAGATGSGAAELSTPLEPMLATLGARSDIRDEDDWAFEMKWDGVRAIVTLAPGVVRLTSRSGRDMSAQYPELRELLSCVDASTLASGEMVLDGEIVALDARDRPSFGRLQQRIGLSDPAEIEQAQRSVPAHLMLFDLLRAGGESLLRRPYRERRDALFAAVTPGDHVHLPHADHGDADHAIAVSQELHLEGVMAKRESSTYLPGKRAKTWIKLKNKQHQEVVVIGWRRGNGARADVVGSLLVAVPDDAGTMHYAGRVGSGFSDKELSSVRARLDEVAQEQCPVDDVPAADRRDASWVRPELVAEVEYAERTLDTRLRHPVWRGWRPEKTVADVRWE